MSSLLLFPFAEASPNGEYVVEDNKPGLLNIWAEYVSLFHIAEETAVFELIRELTTALE